MKRNGCIRRKKVAVIQEVVRVAIYCRKSTDEHLDLEFNSLDAQREAAESYIRIQKAKKWEVLSERYDDGGYTGANTNRPAFQRLLQDIVDGKIDVVAVYRYDRLSRSVPDFHQTLKFFEKYGVEFVAVSQNIDTTSETGMLFANILMSFSQYEREAISARTKDKMGATRRKGMWTGGRLMLGYDLMDKKLVINKAEAAQVREIFKLYLEMGSILAVAVELNRRGWTTKSFTTKDGKKIKGKPFGKGNLQRILVSPLYIGQVEYDGELYEGQHDAIVDEKLFNAVQEQLESHRVKNKRGSRNKWNALLVGLAKCGVCGSSLTHHYVSKAGKRNHYYVCERILKINAAACPGSRIAMKRLEDAVVEKIRIIGQDPTLLKETLAALRRDLKERGPELEGERQRLEQERKRLLSERRELLSSAEKNESTASISLERLKEIESRLDKLKGRMSEVQQEINALKAHPGSEKDLRTALRAFGPVWDYIFPPEKMRIIHLLIDSVLFNGKDQTVEIRFHPNGIQALAAEFTEETAA